MNLNTKLKQEKLQWIEADCPKKSETINFENHCNFLYQFAEKIREKRTRSAVKIIFHQDNALKGVLTVVKLNELKYLLIEHPPYSPDLTPNNYYLF